MLQNVLLQASDLMDGMDQLLGISFFDDEIDQVIFQTNQFLVGGGADNGGPFFWIMQFSLTLGALFAVIMASGMAYKMMVKGEPFDPLKLLRVLGIAMVMFFWYGESPGSSAGSGVLDVLAYAPNAIGSWTHQMYEAEALLFDEGGFGVTPLYYYTNFYCLSDRVKNAASSTLGFYLFMGATEA